MVASDLQSRLDEAGVQVSWVTALEEKGVFLVYLVAVKGVNPVQQAERMRRMPEMLAVERRHTDYIYRVKVVTG